MNNKIIFTTLIAMSALLCTQKSLSTVTFLTKKGAVVKGGVPIKDFDKDYNYDFKQKFDVVKNETKNLIQVIFHTEGRLTPKLPVDVGSGKMKPVGSLTALLNKPEDRMSLEIRQCTGVNKKGDKKGEKNCSTTQATNYTDKKRFKFKKENNPVGTGRIFTITEKKDQIYEVKTSLVKDKPRH